MLARLWWKEARLFVPVWVFLVLTAAVCQWVALRYAGDDVRTGVLPAMAVGWSCLYAFAVGSAAFAGERETRTLTFLDTLPVGRGLLWGGKVTFALGSTLALAVVLVAVASVNSDRWWVSEAGVAAVGLGAAALVFEVMGWALLCSSFSATALTAAVLAVVLTFLVSPLMRMQGDFGTWGLVHAAPYRLALALAAVAASAVPVAWYGPGGRARRGPRLVVRIEQPEGPEPGPAVGRRVGSSWRPALVALTWQAASEAWPVWWPLAVLCVVLPLALGGVSLGMPPAAWFFLDLFAGVVAGASVFGAENRARTHQFLAHHGARPGLVWGVKLAVWACGAALLWAPLGITWGEWFIFRRKHDPAFHPAFFVALPATGFAIGVLCGMSVRRGITAVVLAVVGVFAVAAVEVALGSQQMLPWAVMSLLPAALVTVSWAWSADWMLDRQGAGRWVRLGVLTAGALAVVFGTYVGIRIWEVPALGTEQENSLALTVPTPPAPGENAADLYREAARTIDNQAAAEMSSNMSGQPMTADAGQRGTEHWLDANAGPLELARRASRMPRCEFSRLDGLTLFGTPALPDVDRVANLLLASARERQERGDLAGAWDDLESALRMGRQLNGPVPVTQAFHGLRIERDALGLAMRWAADAKQTPERVAAALAAFRALPPMPSPLDPLRAEAYLAARTLDLPRDELVARITESRWAPGRAERGWENLWVVTATTPWELARARRALPLLFAAKASQAAPEPYQRNRPDLELPAVFVASGTGPSAVVVPYPVTDHILQSTPLARFLFLNSAPYLTLSDQNEVARRALVHILALRGWQLRHGGKLPDSLTDPAVREELGPLPNDPYSGHPFGYVRSTGQSVAPLGRLGEVLNAADYITVNGPMILYSVGADRRVGGATRTYSNNDSRPERNGDICFPLEMPPVKRPSPAERPSSEDACRPGIGGVIDFPEGEEKGVKLGPGTTPLP